MSAIEIIAMMQNQKSAGENTVLPGKISAGSSKSDPSNYFLGIMQMTMTEYQNKNQVEEKLAPEADDKQSGKMFLVKNQSNGQANVETKKVAATVSSERNVTMSVDEISDEELKAANANPTFIFALMDNKMIARSRAIDVGETDAETFLTVQKDGKKGLVSMKELLLDATADNRGSKNKKIHALMANTNPRHLEANLEASGDMKNHLVMALEEKGIPAAAIEGILNAVVKSSDQIIMAKAPGREQYPQGKFHPHVESTSPSYSQAIVEILEKKGFSTEDIQSIMNAVEKTKLAGLKSDVRPSSCQQIYVHHSLYQNEFVKEANVGRKSIHDDIYKKDSSLKDLRSTAIGVGETESETFLSVQRDGKKGLVSMKELLFDATADNRGSKSKEINALMANANPHHLEANLDASGDMKNQLVMALEEKGIPTVAIEGILNAVVKSSDQIIMAKAPGAEQYLQGKFQSHVESTSPSYSQAIVEILEKKGFSTEDIKSIMNAVEKTKVLGLKSDIRASSDQQIYVQHSLYENEFVKEANVGRKRIHDDIYIKDSSLKDFRHENIEVQLKINTPEKQLVRDGQQKEQISTPDKNSQSGKQNVFPGLIRETDNKKAFLGDKDIASQQLGKVNMATDQDEQGKWHVAAGNLSTKQASYHSHEDINLSGGGGEQAPLHPEFLNTTTKGADFQAAKISMDNTKSIYQSVVDQIQDSFALVQNKDNGQVRLTLKPEIMGHLDMQISVRNENVQIMMTVENEKVHQAMNAHIDDLKTALQNQGLKIDKIEVAIQYQRDQERPFYQDQSNPRFDNPGQNSRHERMVNQGPFSKDDISMNTSQEIIRTQNSMEGVSIFA